MHVEYGKYGNFTTLYSPWFHMRFFCYQIDILFQFVLNFLDNALWMKNRD